MKRLIQYLPLLACVLAPAAYGQTGSNGLFEQCSKSGSVVYGKLVCQFPYSVGLYSNATALVSNPKTTPSAAVIATIFNSAIATQVSQLPISTATAGTVLLYENGAYRTLRNQGPILTDRPQTVGKHHVFLGFTASQYVFNSIDGQSLGALQFAYARSTDATSTTPASTTYTTEQTKLAFRLDQYVSMMTYGLTDRWDISAIIPAERVSIGASSSAINNWVVSGSSSFGPYTTSLPYTRGSASGMGDGIIATKYLLWNGAHKSKDGDPSNEQGAGRTNLAAGVSLRLPLGDDLNLLGSGAFGVNPYLVVSYLAAVSPHAKIGYQWNGTTELNPSVVTSTSISGSSSTTTQTTGANQALPGGYVYDLGFDWAASKRITIAVDLMGNQYLNSIVLSTSSTSIDFNAPVTAAGGCTKDATSANKLNCKSTSYNTSSYTLSKLSTGIKWNPAGSLVLSANVLTQLNNMGLRSRPVPLLGISYKF